MLKRVAGANNPASKDYEKYKIYRGLTVYPEWFCFPVFLEAMGLRPPGTTLDRIDGNLGYFPGNCRWATPNQQARNTIVRKSSVSGVTGVTKRVGPRRGWEARITVDRKAIKLGTFKTIAEAAATRKAAEDVYWGTDK